MPAKSEYYNLKVETARQKTIRSLQLRKLRRQLDYVSRNSKFYRDKFTQAGNKRIRIRKLADLAALPFTEKDELRMSQERFLPLGEHAAAPISKVVRIHSSSGTTGRPTYVGITRRDRQIWNEIVARCLYTEGIRPGVKVVHAMGLSFFVGGLPVHDAVQEIGATFIPIGTGASDRVFIVIKDAGGDTLHCTPSYAIYFADYVRTKYGEEPRNLGLRRIVSGAEPGAGVPSIRKRIEEDWNADLREGMGNADVAPIVFGECFVREGMHFSAPDYILPELIDPRTGEIIEMSEGAEGELVYTHLERECVPLVRFRSRDHVRVWTNKCECGRTGFRIRCIGRTDDMLKIRGVTVFPSAIKDVVASLRPLTTGEVEIQLSQPPPLVEPPLRMKVEYAKTFSGNLEGLRRQVEEELRSKLVFAAQVELVPEGALPRYEMKASYVKRAY